MINIHQTLEKYFGFSVFRAQQEEIIHAVLGGSDVLALLPTGGGKSLCYQVPALSMDGLCLVISPLIALMKDQVDQLRKRNVTAFAIHSGMSFAEVKQTFKTASERNCKFLYLSPERLQTRLFKEWLLSLDIRLIAVDEAHCISQWGYDFRPTYLKVAELRDQLPGVPVLAVTASATSEVQEDICNKLLFKRPKVFRQSFARPNLSFSVFRPGNKYLKLKEILQNVPGAALVYCKNRRRTRDIAQLLLADGFEASYYHAGLGSELRNERQQEWISNKTRVMVCTNAFGMGIDKPNVRVVVHMDVPECQENYYQEAGRAGRDGKKAYAVLLSNENELKDMDSLPGQKYPPMPQIRLIYQSLCNYLQLPEGVGENEYYDFDIREFCERWKLDAPLVMNVLKTLEQAGYIAFQENVFTPSKVSFTMGREQLLQFETEHPLLEPMIKCLLRSYDGIFTNMVAIFESRISKLLRQEQDVSVRQLKALAFYKVIDYRAKKDNPQVFFIYNRVNRSEVVIDYRLYQKRKKGYEERIRHMVEYVVNNKDCRSEVLRTYFGEKKTERCGICDVCLRKKDKPIGSSLIIGMSESLKLVMDQPLHLEEIRQKIPGSNRHLLDATIRYLLAEELAGYDLQGRLFWKK